MKSIIRWGISDQTSEEIQEKIILTNQINLVLIVVNVLLFSLTIGNQAVFATNVVGLLIVTGSLFANRLSLTDLSRFATANYAMIVIGMSQGFQLPPGQAPIASSTALSIAVVTLAFVLFTPSEWKKILIATAINFVFFLGYPVWSNLLYTAGEGQKVTTPEQQMVVLAFSFITMVGILYLQLRSSRRMGQKNQEMLQALQQEQQDNENTQQELESTLNEIQQNRQEDERRNWAAEGLTQATRILREDEDLKTLCDRLIAFTVKYISANQGGLFIINEVEGEDVLDLYGCFAYDRKKYLTKHIAIGEGLLGQAYLERQYVHLTEIPTDYVTITSGLGKATPTSLLIVPMIVSDTVEGLLEIASFHPFEDHQIAFLQNLGETIASAVRNVKISEKTRKLLEMSQQQAEEMRAQEEEMRQNMEELQATQEEMHRKEQEYLQRIESLETQAQEAS